MVKGKLIALICTLVSVLVGSIFIITFVIVPKTRAYRTIKIFKLSESASVKVIRNDEELDAQLDMKLKNNDTLTTGENSEAILKLDSDKFVSIKEKTTIHLMATGKKNNTKTRIIVDEGGIVVEVKEKLKEKEAFEVATSNSVIAIRGTIFGVNIDKTETENKATYKLIKGSIDLNIIEFKDNTYSLSNLKINMMQEVNIISQDTGIVDSDRLNDALDNMDKNTNIQKITINDVSEFDSVSGKVSLGDKELTLWDIVDELGMIVDNYDQGVKRVVAQNATFEVLGTTVVNDVVYENEKAYRIRLKAYDREDCQVYSWWVNGKIVEGTDTLVLDITKSTLVYPIYDYDVYTISLDDDYSNYLLASGRVPRNNKCYAKPGEEIEFSFDDSAVLFAYILVEDGVETILSSDYKFTYKVTKNIELKVLYVDLTDGYEEIRIFDKNTGAEYNVIYATNFDDIYFDDLVFTLKGVVIPNELIEYNASGEYVRFNLKTDEYIRTKSYDLSDQTFHLSVFIPMDGYYEYGEFTPNYEMNISVDGNDYIIGCDNDKVDIIPNYVFQYMDFDEINRIHLKVQSFVEDDIFIGWFYYTDGYYYQFTDSLETTYVCRKTSMEGYDTLIVPIFESMLSSSSWQSGRYCAEYDAENDYIHTWNNRTRPYTLTLSSNEPVQFEIPKQYCANFYYGSDDNDIYLMNRKFTKEALIYVDESNNYTEVEDFIIDPTKSGTYYLCVYYTMASGVEFDTFLEIEFEYE